MCLADTPGPPYPRSHQCSAVPLGTVKSFSWICSQKAKLLWLCMKRQRRPQETGHGGDELIVILSVLGTVGSGE